MRETRESLDPDQSRIVSLPTTPERGPSSVTAKTLVIAFESKALRTLCEDDAHAESKFGAEAARMLRNRLADLRSANSLQELLAGNPRVRDDSDEMLVNISEGLTLVFEANHVSNPQTAGKRVDWHRVSRIKLVRIEK